MPCYESVFIARQDIPTTQVETLSTAFADIIRSNGGQVTKVEPWGLRNLTYRIKKNKKGHYVLFNLDAPASAIVEMERQMSLHEDVLRFLTVRVEGLEAGPSAVLRRDERDGDKPDSFDRDRGERPARAPRREAPAEEGV